MKYLTGQQVILLDTGYKPVVTAVIIDLEPETGKYLVEYRLREGGAPEKVWVPQERLSVLPEFQS